MNILFLIYHGFSEYSGISKKIHSQIEAFKSLGHNLFVCTYDIDNQDNKQRKINNIVIEDFGKGKIASIKNRIKYSSIIDFSIKHNIDFVYTRSFHNANPFTIMLFDQFKRNHIKSVIEIPTYPYDYEYNGFGFQSRCKLFIDKLFRNILSQKTDAIVTFTNDKIIFGQKTICISNGVDFNNILIKKNTYQKSELNLIGVAEVHYWHGFDRIIHGIGEYYKNGGNKEIFFHIVGGIGPSEMYNSINAPGFKELTDQYNIQNRIIYHGQLFGEELDKIFNLCDFAIGSLGRHRSGIMNIKTLKNREYAARGIPFIYSETDDDFDNKPYIIKAPANESAINIQNIIDFMDTLIITPLEIRNSILNLSWKEQMRIVIEKL